MGAGGDYEQEKARPAYAAAGGLGYQELYVLAALEPHQCSTSSKRFCSAWIRFRDLRMCVAGQRQVFNFLRPS